jgi:hypothetical protein
MPAEDGKRRDNAGSGEKGRFPQMRKKTAFLKVFIPVVLAAHLFSCAGAFVSPAARADLEAGLALSTRESFPRPFLSLRRRLPPNRTTMRPTSISAGPISA